MNGTGYVSPITDHGGYSIYVEDGPGISERQPLYPSFPSRHEGGNARYFHLTRRFKRHSPFLHSQDLAGLPVQSMRGLSELGRVMAVTANAPELFLHFGDS
jgi:hypothetical protein